MFWVTVAARNLALAETLGYDMVVVCNGCFDTLTEVNHAMNTIGGVRRDITRDMIPKIEKKLNILEKAVKNYIKIAATEPLIRKRTVGIGVLTKDEAKEVGVVGLTARALNVGIDVRKDDPYLAYEETSWDMITQPEGDVYAKVVVILLELQQSISICKQCLDFLKTTSGPTQAEVPREFPEGKEAVGRVEAPRGELTYYIRSNGTHILERVRIRAPSFLNNPSTLYMLRDQMVADAPIVIASIDPTQKETIEKDFEVYSKYCPTCRKQLSFKLNYHPRKYY